MITGAAWPTDHWRVSAVNARFDAVDGTNRSRLPWLHDGDDDDDDDDDDDGGDGDS